MLVFKFLSDAQLRWYTTLAGAVFTTGLFAIGKIAIGIYLLRSGLGGGYGAAGSFVVLLTWIYYSAAIFLLGAEFIKVYAGRVGDHLSLKD
jgi:membrane protein